MNLIKIARKILPTAIVKNVRDNLPRSMTIGPPITQIFICDGEIQSKYTLTDFPSFFSPKHAADYVYNVTIYDEQGNVAGTKKMSISKFGTIEIVPEKTFDFKLPKFGMISVGIEPLKRFSFSDRHLGIIFPHFFAMYHDRDMASTILLHPQTNSMDVPEPNLEWKSNLLINTENLDRLEVYQINPSHQSADTDLMLCDQDHNVLMTSKASMKPRSTRKVEWDVSGLGQKRFLYVGSSGLTGSNAKPLVINRLTNGVFSGSHS